MTRTLVFNGWAAGPEAWDLCTFPRDWVFDYVEQLDGVPERVISDFDDVILVGFSMGGTMALQAMLAHREKVRGLVLVSSTARMMEDPSTDWKGMSVRRREALLFGTRRLFHDEGSRLFCDRNLVRGIDYLERTDLRAQLADFRAGFPVEILQSERDGLVRPANADYLRRVFPQARVEMVPGGEHVLPILVPEKVDAAVARVRAASAAR